MFPVLSRAARYQALIIAGLAAASMVAQWVYLMGYRGTGPLETVIDMVRYFTILTTGLVVMAFLTVGLSKTRGLGAPTLAALTLSVVLTGAVYHALLAAAWNPTGVGRIADWGLHTIVPAAVVLWWCARRGILDLDDPEVGIEARVAGSKRGVDLRLRPLGQHHPCAARRSSGRRLR
jgi:hypothetical protein